MKKTLLSLLMFVVAMTTAWAGDVVFDFTNPTALTPSVTPQETASGDLNPQGVSIDGMTFTNGGVSLSFDQGTASNPAKVWTQSEAKGFAKELRAYKNGTFTISATENITAVTFAGASISAINVEGVAVADGKWTGSATSVTFSITKTLNINSITVTTDGEAGGEGEGGEEGGTTPEPETAKTLWSEAFSANQGDFTIDNKVLPESLSYVWQWSSYGSDTYMKASGYKSGAKDAESWLVSPVLDMTKATEAALNFKHAGKFFGTMADEIKVMACVAEGTWAELPIDAYPTNTDYTFVDATVDLSAYVGKKMQFAFVYKSTTAAAGTWEVKDVAITGQGEVAVDVPEVPVPEYTSIVALKEAAAATAAEMTFKFTDLLVTGVIGKSVYVTDGADGLLIYGVAPTFKKGDKISGSIAGNIVLYNELTEITNPDFTNVTVSSSDNAVAAKVVTIAELLSDGTDKYENVLIKLEEVSFNAAALSNRNVTITDAEDNDITVRDNFNVLTNYTFDTGKTYNVTAFVGQYKGTVQLYPGSADDLEIITNLVDAESAWAAEEVVILPGEDRTVNNAFTTKSNATVTYTSSNEAVATVDAEGKVTVTGFGLAEITAETEENETYLGSKVSFKLYVIEGEGTLEKPYSVADAQYYYEKVTEKVWVKGVIGGYYTNDGLVADITEAPASNLALGTADCCIPVNLKNGSDARTALNLVDNPDKLNATVWLYGNIEKYFSVAGLKNVTDYSLDGVITTGIEGVEAENGVKVIYDLSGRRVQQAQKGLYIINGKKVLVK